MCFSWNRGHMALTQLIWKMSFSTSQRTPVRTDMLCWTIRLDTVWNENKRIGGRISAVSTEPPDQTVLCLQSQEGLHMGRLPWSPAANAILTGRAQEHKRLRRSCRSLWCNSLPASPPLHCAGAPVTSFKD